jgi:hypothetical protein
MFDTALELGDFGSVFGDLPLNRRLRMPLSDECQVDSVAGPYDRFMGAGEKPEHPRQGTEADEHRCQ